MYFWKVPCGQTIKTNDFVRQIIKIQNVLNVFLEICLFSVFTQCWVRGSIIFMTVCPVQRYKATQGLLSLA